MEAAQLFSIHESVISVAKGDDATTVPFLKVGEAKGISVKEFLFSLGHRKWFLWGGGGVQRGCRKRRFCFLWSAKTDPVPAFCLFVLSFLHYRGYRFFWDGTISDISPPGSSISLVGKKYIQHLGFLQYFV